VLAVHGLHHCHGLALRSVPTISLVFIPISLTVQQQAVEMHKEAAHSGGKRWEITASSSDDEINLFSPFFCLSLTA